MADTDIFQSSDSAARYPGCGNFSILNALKQVMTRFRIMTELPYSQRSLTVAIVFRQIIHIENLAFSNRKFEHPGHILGKRELIGTLTA